MLVPQKRGKELRCQDTKTRASHHLMAPTKLHDTEKANYTTIVRHLPVTPGNPSKQDEDVGDRRHGHSHPRQADGNDAPTAVDTDIDRALVTAKALASSDNSQKKKREQTNKRLLRELDDFNGVGTKSDEPRSSKRRSRTKVFDATNPLLAELRSHPRNRRAVETRHHAFLQQRRTRTLWKWEDPVPENEGSKPSDERIPAIDGGSRQTQETQKQHQQQESTSDALPSTNSKHPKKKKNRNKNRDKLSRALFELSDHNGFGSREDGRISSKRRRVPTAHYDDAQEEKRKQDTKEEHRSAQLAKTLSASAASTTKSTIESKSTPAACKSKRKPKPKPMETDTINLAETFGLKAGDQIEVRWEIHADDNDQEEDTKDAGSNPAPAAVSVVWWKATLLEYDGRKTTNSMAIRSLLYEPLPEHGFTEASEEDVVFYMEGILWTSTDVDSKDWEQNPNAVRQMPYRRIQQSESNEVDDSFETTEISFPEFPSTSSVLPEEKAMEGGISTGTTKPPVDPAHQQRKKFDAAEEEKFWCSNWISEWEDDFGSPSAGGMDIEPAKPPPPMVLGPKQLFALNPLVHSNLKVRPKLTSLSKQIKPLQKAFSGVEPFRPLPKPFSEEQTMWSRQESVVSIDVFDEKLLYTEPAFPSHGPSKIQVQQQQWHFDAPRRISLHESRGFHEPQQPPEEEEEEVILEYKTKIKVKKRRALARSTAPKNRHSLIQRSPSPYDSMIPETSINKGVNAIADLPASGDFGVFHKLPVIHTNVHDKKDDGSEHYSFFNPIPN